MEGRGKRSAASLTVLPTAARQLLEPVPGLNERQAELWRGIVQTKPAEWFDVDTAPLLAEYVRAVDMLNLLSAQIEAVLVEGGEETTAQLKPLLDMRDKESKRATSIATKLRLTQQSRYTPQAAATANKRASTSRPWAG